MYLLQSPQEIHHHTSIICSKDWTHFWTCFGHLNWFCVHNMSILTLLTSTVWRWGTLQYYFQGWRRTDVIAKLFCLLPAMRARARWRWWFPINLFACVSTSQVNKFRMGRKLCGQRQTPHARIPNNISFAAHLAKYTFIKQCTYRHWWSIFLTAMVVHALAL